jgi:hypothetical protein
MAHALLLTGLELIQENSAKLLEKPLAVIALDSRQVSILLSSQAAMGPIRSRANETAGGSGPRPRNLTSRSAASWCPTFQFFGPPPRCQTKATAGRHPSR